MLCGANYTDFCVGVVQNSLTRRDIAGLWGPRRKPFDVYSVRHALCAMGKVQELIKTLQAAIGVQKFAISGAVAFVVEALKYLGVHGMAWTLLIPPGVVWVAVVVCLVSFWLLKYATEVRLQAEPQLRIDFETGQPFTYEVTHQPNVSPYNAQKYRCYRFRVSNSGGQILHHCKAQMWSVTRDDGCSEVGIPFSLRQDRSGDETFTLRQGESAMVSILAVPLAKHIQSTAKVAAIGETWPQFSVTGTAISTDLASTIVVTALSEAPMASQTFRFETGADGFYEVKKVEKPRPSFWRFGVFSRA